VEELNSIEESKRMRLQEQIIDEEEERKAADLKRKNDRLKRTQHLIDVETKRQMETKRTQEDFLDRQVERQTQKESQRVMEMAARKTKLREERTKEGKEAAALRATIKKEKIEKRKNKRFPLDEDSEAEELGRRDLARQRSRREVQEFQQGQAQEKKERKVADRERERLEEQQFFADDRAFLSRAQQYASDMLARVKEQEDEKDRAVLGLG
jgi:hypothetical protein